MAKCPERALETFSGYGGRDHNQQQCPTWLRERRGKHDSGVPATNGTISSSVAKHNLHADVFC